VDHMRKKDSVGERKRKILSTTETEYVEWRLIERKRKAYFSKGSSGKVVAAIKGRR
jgi:hypothetical protein